MDKPVFIAGPCVIESAELLDTVAQELVRINQKYGIDIIFKASFDKANRTSLKSFRGPGLEKGLEMLADIKLRYGLRILTDIHEAPTACSVRVREMARLRATAALFRLWLWRPRPLVRRVISLRSIPTRTMASRTLPICWSSINSMN